MFTREFGLVFLSSTNLRKIYFGYASHFCRVTMTTALLWFTDTRQLNLGCLTCGQTG